MADFQDVMNTMLPTVDLDTAGVVYENGYQTYWKDRLRVKNNVKYWDLHNGFDFNVRDVFDPTNVSDINSTESHNVFAPVGGTVTIHFNSPYNTVSITDSNGFTHQILHMNSFNPDWQAAIDQADDKGAKFVVLKNEITAGTQIGVMGNAGADGIHVHYQLKSPEGKSIDPVLFHEYGLSVESMLDLEILRGDVPFADPKLEALYNELLAKQELYNGKNIWRGLLSEYLLPGSDLIIQGQTWAPPRRDPLTFDLDGDGLETLSIDAGVQFDHNGDGIKTATGWISPDDGLMVLDRNGNGTIDNGTELFGDSTPLSNGETAEDGFQALADLDSNFDGKIDATDDQFNDLRIWQDLNSDGISQSDELLTLQSLGIKAINLQSVELNKLLPDDNLIADIGTFEYLDGSTSGFGVTGELGDVDLREDTYFSEFVDILEQPDSFFDLPDMGGRGQVRDLLQAAVLSKPLENLLIQFTAENTRAGQQALLDETILEWIKTSTMEDFSTKALNNGYLAAYTFATTAAYGASPNSFDITKPTGSTDSVEELVWSEFNQNQTDAYKLWLDRLDILESFMGRTLLNFNPPDKTSANEITINITDEATGAVTTHTFYRMDTTVANFAQNMIFFEQAYNYFRESLYINLSAQTRLAPYFGSIIMNYDEVTKTATADFSVMRTLINDRIAADPIQGLLDSVDIFRMLGRDELGWIGQLEFAGWDGATELSNTFEIVKSTPEGAALLTDPGAVLTPDATTLIGDVLDNILNGSGANEVIAGGADNDTVNGNGGGDYTIPLADNDTHIADYNTPSPVTAGLNSGSHSPIPWSHFPKAGYTNTSSSTISPGSPA